MHTRKQHAWALARTEKNTHRALPCIIHGELFSTREEARADEDRLYGHYRPIKIRFATNAEIQASKSLVKVGYGITNKEGEVMKLKVWDKRKDAEQRCKWLKPRNPELKVGIMAIDMDTVD